MNSVRERTQENLEINIIYKKNMVSTIALARIESIIKGKNKRREEDRTSPNSTSGYSALTLMFLWKI